MTEPIHLTDRERDIVERAIANAVARETAKLREALEFYADDRRYQGPNVRLAAGSVDPFAPAGSPYFHTVDRDVGEVARAALSGLPLTLSEVPQPSGDGWMPIETAPTPPHYSRARGMCFDDDKIVWFENGTATHWRHFPAPPTT